MFKLVVLFALIAAAVARPGLLGAYTAPVSGYAYSASVHAPDYVNHVSVSSPLVAGSVPLVRSYPSTYVSPYLAPSIHAYSAPSIHGYSAPLLHY